MGDNSNKGLGCRGKGDFDSPGDEREVKGHSNSGVHNTRRESLKEKGGRVSNPKKKKEEKEK